MNQIILDFEGERLILPHSISTVQSFTIPRIKFQHNGNVYEVVDKIITGTHEKHKAFAQWDQVNAIPDTMDIIFTLKKV